MRRLLPAALVGLLASCSPQIPDATYVCDTTAECPPGMACFGGLCVREPGDAGTRDGGMDGCEPQTCAELRAQCGRIDDGCGTEIDCGECTAPEECGVGGIANLCDCVARTCEADECGARPNGCGGEIECGGCPGGQTCGDGRCGCTPVTCEADTCGTIPDGCGGTVTCPPCAGGETCGGGDVPNRCGSGTCTPMTECPPEQECGLVSDGCGDVISCGTCAAPDTCGGGDPGSPNVCGCTPQTCADLGAQCGEPTDACGDTLDCGTCTSPSECTDAYECVCTPPTCEPGFCGAIENPCGTPPTITCGCGTGQACVAGSCCALDPAEPNDTAAGAHDWGTIDDEDPPLVTSDYAIHRANRDWFTAGLDTRNTGRHRVSVELTGIPAGQDYDLEVWVRCSGIISDTPTCSPGSEVMSGGPARAVGGCRASASGSADEAIGLTATCVFERVWVQVEPQGDAGCAPSYTLDVDFTVSSITGG
ncbi:MAG TPA: hypothetical protein RMH99_23855 [Sandaracinaceae bacterium LLY-WYZ-13_1]|nr:hypothetical protein [Sandaracinaceae bacterium LLY-WYZ-13_1]